MYRVTSTAGLSAEVPTIEQAVAELGHHLQDLSGSVHWHIVTPRGSDHLGYLRLSRPQEIDFVDETIDEITENLRSEARGEL